MSQKENSNKLSSSPERHSFQRQSRLDQREALAEHAPEDLDFWDQVIRQEELKEQDPEWQKDNLEYDLRSTDWILQKARLSRTYSQNLYAALCNNDFQKIDVIPILKDQRWSCSWRYAGGIVAHMRQEGDYIDWYCSGINAAYEDEPDTRARGEVAEGVVTDEIRQDLLALGWAVLPEN